MPISTIRKLYCMTFFALVIALSSIDLSYGDISIFDNDKMVTLANKNNKIQHDIKHDSFDSINKLLKERKYVEVDKTYEALFQKSEDDVNYESALMAAYDIFSPARDITLEDINLWIRKTGSYIAYAARGKYKTALGFESRGGKYINETPKYKLVEMQRWFDEGADDLLAALKINPKLTPAYVTLITMAKAADMPFTKEQILARAEQTDPRSFYLRYHYMTSLVPEWGGSYEEMAAFARHAVTFANLNPRLWVLQGSPYADIAKKHARNSNYASAVEYYSKALEYGDMYSWLSERAKCYLRLGNKDKAKADYERVLYYEPQDKTALAFFGPADAIDIKYSTTDQTNYDRAACLKYSSCAVLFVDHRTEWLKRAKTQNNYKINRNLVKIEHAAKFLGYKVVDRTTVLAALDGNLGTIENFTEEEVKKHGRKTGAEVLIAASITGVGKNNYSGVYFQEMVIIARSAVDGRVLWESSLKGSAVDSAFNNYDYMTILDGIEDRLYEIFQKKLEPIKLSKESNI